MEKPRPKCNTKIIHLPTPLLPLGVLATLRQVNRRIPVCSACRILEQQPALKAITLIIKETKCLDRGAECREGMPCLTRLSLLRTILQVCTINTGHRGEEGKHTRLLPRHPPPHCRARAVHAESPLSATAGFCKWK